MSYYIKHLKGINLERFATHKAPRRGKCKNSCFANGWHRTGMVPLESVLDGGLPGDSAQEFCVECGKGFKHRCFIPKRQPRNIVECKKTHLTTGAIQNA